MRFQESYLSSEQLVRRNAGNVMRPTLKEGSSGTQVSAWQGSLQRLNRAAWNAAVAQYGQDPSGDFGPATKSATRSFQRSKGLTVDGIVGCNSWKAIGIPASQIEGCQARSAPAPAHHHAETAIDTTDKDKDEKVPFYKKKWFVPLTVGVVVFGLGVVLIAKKT